MSEPMAVSVHRLARSLFILFVFSLLAPWFGAQAYEEASYEVVRTYPTFEIRDYAPAAVALVTTTGSRDDAVGVAFRKLFRFIGGDNQRATKIDMTTPVVQSKTLSDAAANRWAEGIETWQIAFFMPTDLQETGVPAATDPDIEILPLPARRVAVITFSGRWRDQNFETHLQRLRDALAAEGITAVGEPFYAYFDPPFMPFFMRRNEVMLEVMLPEASSGG